MEWLLIQGTGGGRVDFLPGLAGLVGAGGVSGERRDKLTVGGTIILHSGPFASETVATRRSVRGDEKVSGWRLMPTLL